MKILPVLDVMAGEVVHGRAGRRDTYRPIVSRLCAGSNPRDIAHAFRTHFGLEQLYVADLDAIAGGAPALHLYRSLRDDGFTLWVDAGVHTADAGLELFAAGVSSVIVGLETLPDPSALDAVLAALSERRVVFSLDLKQGVPLAPAGWAGADAWRIAVQALARGVGRMIVLDLAAVGMDGGLSTLALCRRLHQHCPHLEITTGGGVRGAKDMDALREVPVDYVLIASALHEGRPLFVD